MSPPTAPRDRIEGTGVVLRRARRPDVPALAEIVSEPDVAPWWPMAEPEDEFLNSDYPTYVIEVDGQTAGLIMFWEEDDQGYRHAGMDIAVATRFQRRGIGSASLRAMMRYLVRDRGHHRLTIDPAAANERAIAVYEYVGFKPVGIMRRYERGPDGEWRDGLLMDVLAEEVDTA
jgi:aminoglycoside 6'-N-acetyltransferase